jgi:hypothetical protein
MKRWGDWRFSPCRASQVSGHGLDLSASAGTKVFCFFSSEKKDFPCLPGLHSQAAHDVHDVGLALFSGGDIRVAAGNVAAGAPGYAAAIQ